MTFEEMKKLPKKEQEKLYKEIKIKRHTAKTTLYSATYGAYPPKIAKTADISIEQAEQLWKTYWERNWSITEIAESCAVEEYGEHGEKWLYNPVSGFWYSLRHEKDRFSTLNQGTGAFCFDMWVGYVIKQRPQITAQFHDEGVWMIKKGHREQMTTVLQQAIKETNEALHLNKQLDIDIKFGDNYGDIH